MFNLARFTNCPSAPAAIDAYFFPLLTVPNLIILAEVLLTALAVFEVLLVRTACSIVVPGRRALLAGRTTPDNGRPDDATQQLS
ncbi:hypothetical protein WR25_10471 [Diploscapter pachys]|uniref:Uncharacterized protein n=1 Tax=Diploscapter pachys TaxID=2018661 RepID=A0A2A2JBC8_9BILA|nr:hypothetical protein WR25_10471 [Diploscapter pachys]